MTRDDIICMAWEAGFITSEVWGALVDGISITEELERFAVLVAAAQREKLAQWMIRRGYATGHGDTIEDLLAELDWQIDEKVEAEREACAKVCEEDAFVEQWKGLAEAAQRIRARGQA